MSKATATKLFRVGIKKTQGIRLEPQPREARPCRYCHKPMMVSAGQVAYFHKECRRKKRDQRGQGKKGR